MAQDQRLYYVDFLRVSAFLILIAYHASIAFFPNMKWLLEAPEGSRTLELIMDFPSAWRLALLFFLSGMGTWFLFRRVSAGDFLLNRFVRLFVPLIFAMCVIVVPQVWYERMYEDGYNGSLLTFWLTRYFAEGKYPEGNFTWAHMWFVAYLLIMTFVCYPVFLLLGTKQLRPVMAWFERVAGSGWIYFLFLLPLSFYIALAPFFPRETNALYNDGAWFSVWASWFGLGFLVARHHAALIVGIIRRRWLSAGIVLALTIILYEISWTTQGGIFIGDYEHPTPLFAAVLFALAWSTILTLVGFAARHMQRPNRAVAWLNRKVFPLYIVHQTVTVAALYYVLQLHIGVWPSFLAVTALTFIGSFAFAILAEWLPGKLGLLVGLAPRSRGASDAQQLRSRRLPPPRHNRGA